MESIRNLIIKTLINNIIVMNISLNEKLNISFEANDVT
jgi:hypothetical protein